MHSEQISLLHLLQSKTEQSIVMNNINYLFILFIKKKNGNNNTKKKRFFFK